MVARPDGGRGGDRAAMKRLPRRKAAVLGLLALALVLLALALLGVRGPVSNVTPGVLLLVDRSHSMPRKETDAAVEKANAAMRAAGAEVHVLEFAGRPAPSDAIVPATEALLEPDATNLEAAIDAALALHARTPLAAALIVSDGRATRGDTVRALRTAREAGLPIQWFALADSPPGVRITSVAAPERVRDGETARITVRVADGRPGETRTGVQVAITARNAAGDTRSVATPIDTAGRATLDIPLGSGGPVLLDVVATDAATGTPLDTQPMAAAIDVIETASMLYVQGSTRAKSALAASLRDGGWTLDLVSTAQADAYAGRLGGYRAVVLDDVAIADAGPRFWQALVDAVRDRGVGLLVLGGERSFALGGYHGSTLQSILPVRGDPAALGDAATVLFVIDKSGSMGTSRGGTDRFQLARRGVQEAASDLGERDTLGVLVFDAEPRLLVPIGPAPEGKEALRREWPVSAHGGTRIAPALEAAIEQLQTAASHRLLVLVTDGFVDDVALEPLRERMARAQIELMVIGVGNDIDANALRRLAGDSPATVLRANEPAELPQRLRDALQRHRARIEHGNIAIALPTALPFTFDRALAWPPVVAYAVTRLQPQATAAVSAANGDPLIAFDHAGAGRVVAVTSGIGAWTPGWLRWREWPKLSGGLLNWLGASASAGEIGLDLTDEPTSLRITADLRAGLAPAAATLHVQRPGAAMQLLAAETVAPGRLQAILGAPVPGLYVVQVATPSGTLRRLHLRRATAERQDLGVNPDLEAWHEQGLLDFFVPGKAAAHRSAGNAEPVLDRGLLVAALLAFVMAVLVDRVGMKRRRGEP